MKRFPKILSIMLCAVSALSLFSCLDSDDDGGIEPAVYKQWLTQMSGYYYGTDGDWKLENKIYFYNDTISGNNKTDSITGITANIYSDSTIVINNVPGRLLAKNIKDNEELKTAIEDQLPTTMKAKFLIYNISSPYAYYFVYPSEVTYPNVVYKNGNHKVTVKFYGPSQGAFLNESSGSKISVPFYVEGVYLDNNVVPSIYDNESYDNKLGKSVLQVYATR